MLMPVLRESKMRSRLFLCNLSFHFLLIKKTKLNSAIEVERERTWFAMCNRLVGYASIPEASLALNSAREVELDQDALQQFTLLISDGSIIAFNHFFDF